MTKERLFLYWKLSVVLVLDLISKRLDNLRRTRRRNRSDGDYEELRTLPGSIAALEESITQLSLELGSPEFQEMPEVSGTAHL